MKYANIVEGEFISRPNRFVAYVKIDGEVEKVHVKNTGRCKELLVLGATVYLEDFKDKMGTRKLRYSVIAVKKGERIINMDSLAPNKVIFDAINENKIKLPNFGEITVCEREKTYKNSRFDIYLEDNKGQKAFLEVKGVTLEEENIARFPDAPTTRGIKHILELMEAADNGYKTYIVFLIQIKDIQLFMPNYITHFEFGKTLLKARDKVEILAYDSQVEKDRLDIGNIVKIQLENSI